MLWSGRVILVGGKVFSWKGNQTHILLPHASAGMGCFGMRYFPPYDTEEKVEIHHGIFKSSVSWDAWMKKKGFHKDNPASEAVARIIMKDSYTGVDEKPIKEATFQLEVRNTKETSEEYSNPSHYDYWWIKNDEQNKDWE